MGVDSIASGVASEPANRGLHIVLLVARGLLQVPHRIATQAVVDRGDDPPSPGEVVDDGDVDQALFVSLDETAASPPTSTSTAGYWPFSPTSAPEAASRRKFPFEALVGKLCAPAGPSNALLGGCKRPSRGMEVAIAYTLAHDRVVRPGLAHLADPRLLSEGPATFLLMGGECGP